MIKDEIVNAYDINPEKIDVVYNGVASKMVDYQGSFNRLSKEFNIERNTPILLYVGSGFKRKGVEEFLEIIAKLKTENIQVFIIGKEKNLEYYKQLSKDLRIDKKVIFTGPRSDVDDFYIISDIFLFPTRYEPFSNVLLEAMSFENAVFTTKQNGAHEILEDEYIMSNSRDFSVAGKIDALLEDVEALSAIKQVNNLKANELSIELNMQKTIEIIKEAQK
jgi:UDP-glucose:(heptosyl)LPS alpha-1,3-glucosyltransferase